MSKTSDSFETFYQFKKVNKKNSIVFIHGVGLNNEIWQTQTNYFKDYNILTYDLPGQEIEYDMKIYHALLVFSQVL